MPATPSGYPDPHPRAGIALGSNLGNRLSHLRLALRELLGIHSGGHAPLVSRVYQTEPRQCPPNSPPFLNAVVEIAWAGTSEALLRETSLIESRLGRQRSRRRNAPRVIDIDILYHGGHTIHTSSLHLPHPRLTERRFVLQPLAEIRPHLILPGHGHTIAGYLAELRSDESEPTIHPETLASD